MEVSGPLQAPLDLPQGKNPRYPLNRRMGGPKSQCRKCNGAVCQLFINLRQSMTQSGREVMYNVLT